MKRSSQSARNSSTSSALLRAGRISASTHSQMIRPPSLAALRSSCSEESACDAESVSTSSSTELSTAVSIASSFQITVDAHAFRQIALSAPFFENVARNLLASNQLSIYGIEFEDGTWK